MRSGVTYKEENRFRQQGRHNTHENDVIAKSNFSANKTQATSLNTKTITPKECYACGVRRNRKHSYDVFSCWCA